VETKPTSPKRLGTFVGIVRKMAKNIQLIFLFLFTLITSSSSAQDTLRGKSLPYIIEKEDTIFVVNLNNVLIEAEGPDYLKNLQAYYRLRFNVIKVYPYARLAAVKLNEMNAKMSTMKSDREKRKYRKVVEEQVRKDFEDQLKKLSINQGDVLIKLIDRETGHSSYELVKDLKGSFNAFFAQSLAKLFGHDLKDQYDPTGADKTIESIVQQIERGEIQF